MNKRLSLLSSFTLIGSLFLSFIWSLLLRFYVDSETTFYTSVESPVYAFQIGIVLFAILAVVLGFRSKKDEDINESVFFGGAPLLVIAAVAVIVNSIFSLVSSNSILSVITAVLGFPAAVAMAFTGLALTKKHLPTPVVQTVSFFMSLYGLAWVVEDFVPNNALASTGVRSFETLTILFIFIYLFQLGCIITGAAKDTSKHVFYPVCSIGAIFSISFSIGVLVMKLSGKYYDFSLTGAIVLFLIGGSMLLNLIRPYKEISVSEDQANKENTVSDESIPESEEQ